MTWIRFTKDFRYSNVRYTEYFKAGDHKNVPRHVAELALSKGAGVKEVKAREKKRQD